MKFLDTAYTIFKFEISKEVTAYTMIIIIIIQTHNKNFPVTLEITVKEIQLKLGLKLHPAHDLNQLCNYHPLLTRVCRLISQGFDIPRTGISDTKAYQDLLIGIERGNHTGMINQP